MNEHYVIVTKDETYNICIDNIKALRKCYRQSRWAVICNYKLGQEDFIVLDNEERRDKVYTELNALLMKKSHIHQIKEPFPLQTPDNAAIYEKSITKGGFNMNNLKNYFEKHQDSLITLAIIIIVDHFIFDGTFRTKIKTSIDGLLDKNVKLLTE